MLKPVLYRPSRLATCCRPISTSTYKLSATTSSSISKQDPADSMAAVRNSVTFRYSSQQKYSLSPLVDKLTQLPLVKDMEADTKVKLEAFYWPAGTQRLLQAPFSLAYGALATPKDLSLLPLVYRWKPNSLPNHLNSEIYKASFSTTKPLNSSKVPGVTMIQYLGLGLGLKGVDRNSRGSAREIVHTGVLSALLDDVTVRVSLSNTPDKPAFTANFKLEYLHPVSVGSFVVLDAWMTKIDGRKTFISSYIADAISHQVLVKAESLFVCAV